jgi:hypothetical protein
VGDLDIGGNVIVHFKTAPGLFGDIVQLGALDLLMAPPFPSLSSARIGGSFIGTGVNEFFINPVSSVAGSVTLNSAGDPFNIFGVSVGGDIGGNLTVISATSSAFVDNVEIGNSFLFEYLGAETAEIGGNVVVVTGNGGDFYTQGDRAVIRGDVTVITGGGDDFFSLGGSVDGSMLLNMGNGTNNLATSAFGPAMTVLGSLTIMGGNGNDDLNGFGTGFEAFVGGNLTVSLGNGANNLDFDGNAGAFVGGSLAYTGGSGLDSVSVSGPNTFRLTANLGVGADTFTYVDLATTLGGATVDFGVDFDLDVYNFPLGFVVSWNQTLKNLP